MRVSAAIIAHPSRKAYVAELQTALDREVPVAWDKISNMWDTSSRAMALYDPAADYHVIIDDDALVAPEFLAGVEKMIEVLPQPSLVGLFVGEDIRLPALLNYRQGVSFLQLAGVLNWGVATAIPTHWIPEMLEWCGALPFPEVDRRMGTFASAHRFPTLYAWPSIVDHRVGPSLRHAGYTRTAINFADEPATSHEWTGSILALPFDSRTPYSPKEMMEVRRQRGKAIRLEQPQAPPREDSIAPSLSPRRERSAAPGRSRAVSKPRLSVAIMAHPSRAKMVDKLVPMLDREPSVVWDRKQNRWDTGQRAMLAFDPAATHHLVLQDDVIPCRDLCAGVEKALTRIPDLAPLALYVGKKSPYGQLVTQLVATAGSDASFIVMERVNWGPGIVVPTAEIPEMIDYLNRYWGDAAYDRRISRWFEWQKRLCYYTWPSLVEHRDSPSLINRGAGRHAHRFLGETTSALTLDWMGRVVTVPQRDRDRVVNNVRSTRRTRGETAGTPGPNYRG